MKAMTVAEMAGSTADSIKDVIVDVLTDLDEDFAADIANHVHQIASSLHTRDDDAPFPTTLADLMECNVDEHVARCLMQHVFASTDIVIGLHTRKMVCALDLFDWEGTGAKQKCDVKMKQVTDAQVKKSISTWLPKGQGMGFQETMESLGARIGGNKKGFRGQLQAVANKRMATKDKQAVMKMADDIACFYKATKSGGRRKCNL